MGVVWGGVTRSLGGFGVFFLVGFLFGCFGGLRVVEVFGFLELLRNGVVEVFGGFTGFGDFRILGGFCGGFWGVSGFRVLELWGFRDVWAWGFWGFRDGWLGGFRMWALWGLVY